MADCFAQKRKRTIVWLNFEWGMIVGSALPTLEFFFLTNFNVMGFVGLKAQINFFGFVSKHKASI